MHKLENLVEKKRSLETFTLLHLGTAVGGGILGYFHSQGVSPGMLFESLLFAGPSFYEGFRMELHNSIARDQRPLGYTFTKQTTKGLMLASVGYLCGNFLGNFSQLF